jgi:alpha-mannosidase
MKVMHPFLLLLVLAELYRGTYGTLNVHVISHTHDDAGWLKTVDQYYYGTHQDMQIAGVQYILDSVVDALLENPDRRFIYAEMAFFMRWWHDQSQDKRKIVSKLVKEKRLCFVNGGYVQHDEATSTYQAMIDQTTLGHRFLVDTFGIVPKIGWQIDPFGHSSTQAGLSESLGFDALFFGRADYQDMQNRKDNKSLEMIWRGSGFGQSQGAGGVFTGNFYSGNYGPLPGFNFEWFEGQDPPIIDNPASPEYNVEERVDLFVKGCLEIANATQGSDIMLTMGSDFYYSNAHVWYKNLDQVIHHVNRDGRVNAFYSTPEQYAATKLSYNNSHDDDKGKIEWPVKDDDFFPYSDSAHSMWTGYLSSRPTCKAYIRSATALLAATRQVIAYTSDVFNSNEKKKKRDAGRKTTIAASGVLEEAVSLNQHHDAVTGTARQHVANDYNRRLYIGIQEARQALLDGIGQLMMTGDMDRGDEEEMETNMAATQRRRLGSLSSSRDNKDNNKNVILSAPSDPGIDAIKMKGCNWLNVTVCEPTVTLSKEESDILVMAYNPLAWWVNYTYIRVPIIIDDGNEDSASLWYVEDAQGRNVPSQVVEISPSTWCVQQLLVDVNVTRVEENGDAEVVFQADLPPVGFNSYRITKRDGSNSGRKKIEEGQEETSDNSNSHVSSSSKESSMIVIDNGILQLQYSSTDGLLKSATLLSNNSSTTTTAATAKTINLTSTFKVYNSSDGLEMDEGRGQSSGAYIFRPNGWIDLGIGDNNNKKKEEEEEKVQMEVVVGPIVSEIRQVFPGSWATLITRLYAHQPWAEVEWTVGPVPIDDGFGKEISFSIESSDIDSGSVFYTDANGREAMKRERDFRPTWELNVTEPVAGNYYPITSTCFIEDGEMHLGLVTDRAQGAGSLRSGQLEVMVMRRNLVDDRRGVAEPLNETACGCINCNCPGLLARGKFYMLLTPVKGSPPSLSDSAAAAAATAAAAVQRRTLQQLVSDPPILGFSPFPSSSSKIHNRLYSLVKNATLPRNVHLLTLMRTEEGGLIVRFAHVYGKEENEEMGLTVEFDLNEVLHGFKSWNKVVELTLSTNQRVSELKRHPYYDHGGEKKREAMECEDEDGGCRLRALVVELRAMEVRTFHLY